ncbi:MAG: hypothetical protein FWF81_10965 [Defluviitaleaceae bacterium]|nr:hypothetical protein [Defluviitaleaceae bacterium]
MINGITKISGEFLASNSSKRASSAVFQLNIENEHDVNNAFISVGFRVPCGGWISASVFDDEGVIIRGTDACGTKFDKKINISEINPRNASFIELLAIDGHSEANGKPSMLAKIASRALIMQELNGKEFSEFNAFTQMDFVETFNNLIDSLCTNKNYETLLWVKSNVEHLEGIL